MGRTIPTYRMQLEAETSKVRRWAKERKVSDRTRKILDRMLDYPFLYASAGGFIHRIDPTEPMLLSIILHHEKMIVKLKKTPAAQASISTTRTFKRIQDVLSRSPQQKMQQVGKDNTELGQQEDNGPNDGH